MALYVCEAEVLKAHRARLGRADRAQSRIRFRRLEDVSLPVISPILVEARRRARLRRPA